MKDKILKLFPLTTQLTPKPLRGNSIWSRHKCNGALCLKQALKDVIDEKTEVLWNNERGSILIKSEGIRLIIGTSESVKFMDTKDPMQVTFIFISQSRILTQKEREVAWSTI